MKTTISEMVGVGYYIVCPTYRGSAIVFFYFEPCNSFRSWNRARRRLDNRVGIISRKGKWTSGPGRTENSRPRFRRRRLSTLGVNFPSVMRTFFRYAQRRKEGKRSFPMARQRAEMTVVMEGLSNFQTLCLSWNDLIMPRLCKYIYSSTLPRITPLSRITRTFLTTSEKHLFDHPFPRLGAPQSVSASVRPRSFRDVTN